MEPGFLPLAPVEGSALVGVPADLAQTLEDRALALARIHRLPPGEPVATPLFGAIGVVVASRPGPELHLAHRSSPRGRGGQRRNQLGWFGPLIRSLQLVSALAGPPLFHQPP